MFQAQDWFSADVDFRSVSRTLGQLSNLVHLALDFVVRWESLPAIFKDALHSTLQLPSFRSLSLTQYTFANVRELESLLSHARGLKELILSDVFFEDRSADPGDPVSQDALVILDP
jgi:hypothetical protein